MIEIGAVCKKNSYQPMIIDKKWKIVPCAISCAKLKNLKSFLLKKKQ